MAPTPVRHNNQSADIPGNGSTGFPRLHPCRLLKADGISVALETQNGSHLPTSDQLAPAEGKGWIFGGRSDAR